MLFYVQTYRCVLVCNTYLLNIQKLTNFRVDPTRFDVLKELYIRLLRNIKKEQPYTHAIYNTNIILCENQWTIEQILACAERERAGPPSSCTH
jgi:secreted Zn-dependent insulinase-like peptidase